MKLKKLASIALAATAVASAAAFASCGKDDTKLKVKEIQLTSEEYAFAVNKSNAQLKSGVNALLTSMKADGSLDALINSYFDGSATFTYQNKTATPADGDFVVATNATFPPFESVEGNAFKGIDIELAYKIAEAQQKTLFVYDMDFNAIIPSVAGAAVNDGESDVQPKTKADIGMAGLTVNDERKKTVDFADSYYESAQVIVVKESDTTYDECKSAADVETILNGKNKDYKIGSQQATTGFMYTSGNEDFEYPGFPVTAKPYENAALALKDLQNGKIDAVILDEQPAKMIVKSMNEQ